MKPPAFSEHHSAVLAFVVEHPGCNTTDVADALMWSYSEARRRLLTLHHRKLVARQQPLRGARQAPAWFPEQTALDAYERAKAALQHGSKQVEPSGNLSPGLAQDGVVAVPALLPGVADV